MDLNRIQSVTRSWGDRKLSETTFKYSSWGTPKGRFRTYTMTNSFALFDKVLFVPVPYALLYAVGI